MPVENDVLEIGTPRSASLVEDRVADRVRPRHDRYAEELERLVEAAFTVVARTGSLDAPVRAILKEAGLSNQAFYRHVESKDELFLLVLDEGRRSLVRYLDRRMQPCDGAEQRLAFWIGGVLAQAADPDTARRTRPFVAQTDRLAERFADEQRRSEDLLIDQVAAAAGLSWDEATVVYDLAFGALARHLRRGTAPDASSIDAVVGVALRLLQGEPS